MPLRTVLFTLAFFTHGLCWIPANLSASTPACDSTAILLDTSSVTVEIDCTPLSVDDEEVDVWYTLYSINGDTVVVIDPGTILISGAGSAIDSVSTSDLFDMIIEALVIKLVENSVIPSSGDCGSPGMTKVFIPNCVFRTGSGSGTSFTPVDICDQSIREVQHCLVNGVASVSISSTGNCGECAYGEWTCGGGGVGFQ